MSYWHETSALQTLPLRKLERLETHRKTRREWPAAACEVVVYASSLAVVVTGAVIINHIWTHVSMIL